MSKSYSTVFFPLSDVDPAGLEEGLVPDHVVYDSNGNPTLKKYIGVEAIKFNLRNILLTIPGENISDPDFGVGLQQYLFELETIDFNSLKSKIEAQISKYVMSEGFVDRFKVEVRVRSQFNALQVVIQFVPSSSKDLQQLVVEVT